jgi:hypothetical protein
MGSSIPDRTRRESGDTVEGMSDLTIRPAFSKWPDYNRRLRDVLGAIDRLLGLRDPARPDRPSGSRSTEAPPQGAPPRHRLDVLPGREVNPAVAGEGVIGREQVERRSIDWKEVRRPLDPVRFEGESTGNRAGEKRLARAGHVLDEHVTVRQEGSQDQAAGSLGADDRATHGGPEVIPDPATTRNGSG